MTSQHPISHITDRPGFRAVGDLESRGQSWGSVSNEYLIGFSLEVTGVDAANQAPAMLEMQRRLLVAIRDFNEQSGRQTADVIRLTWWITCLTWMLGGLAVAQLIVGILQLVGARA